MMVIEDREGMMEIEDIEDDRFDRFDIDIW